jgi:hypothetical protein
MPSFDYERHLEARQSRRMAAEDRFLGRIEKLETAAYAMVGELCREGKTVFYIFPVGGHYREGTRAELISFLIRNNYA